MTFAQRLRQLREKAGLTQEALARGADMSLGNVRNYEQGIREPRWQGVFKLAEALGVDCRAFAVCVNASPAQAAPPKRRRQR
jgi:transcriptional regulator with XRE-family HTH domain